MVLIPDNFGDGGSGLTPRGSGSPTLVSILQAISGGSNTVADLAALSALDDTKLDDGSLVPVETLHDGFFLDKASTATVDGITIVATKSDVGRWHRSNLTSNRWLSQATWYINATTGDDENDGSNGNQLKTLNEFLRRTGTGTLPQFTIINVETDLDEPGGYVFRGDYSSFLQIIGTRTVIGTGTLTSVQLWDDTQVPGQDGQLVDTGIPTSWTASGYLDKMLVMTAGASAGGTAWIVKDLGSTTARFSPMYSDAFTVVDPTADTYEVVGLSKITKTLWLQHEGTIWFQDFDLIGDAPAFLPTILADSGELITMRCRLGGFENTQKGTSQNGFYHGSLVDQDGPFHTEASAIIIFGSALYNAALTISRLASVWIGADSIIQTRTVAANFQAFWGGTLVVRTGAFLGVFDNTTAGLPAVEVRSGAQFRIEGTGKVWGLNWDNSSFGIWVDSDAVVAYPEPDNFTAHFDVDGTGITEVQVGGVPSTYVQVGTEGMTATQKGTAGLTGGTVTVTANITANSRIIVGRNTPFGTIGDLSAPVASRTNNTATGAVGSFVINSASALDTSIVDWVVEDDNRQAGIVPNEDTP